MSEPILHIIPHELSNDAQNRAIVMSLRTMLAMYSEDIIRDNLILSNFYRIAYAKDAGTQAFVELQEMSGE